MDELVLHDGEPDSADLSEKEMKNVKAEMVGFRNYEDAAELLKLAGDRYIIMQISEKELCGEAIAYVVVNKDYDPVGYDGN